MNNIQIYVPIEGTEEENLDEFYKELKNMLDTGSKNNEKSILMGTGMR